MNATSLSTTRVLLKLALGPEHGRLFKNASFRSEPEHQLRHAHTLHAEHVPKLELVEREAPTQIVVLLNYRATSLSIMEPERAFLLYGDTRVTFCNLIVVPYSYNPI